MVFYNLQSSNRWNDCDWFDSLHEALENAITETKNWNNNDDDELNSPKITITDATTGMVVFEVEMGEIKYMDESIKNSDFFG